MNPPEPFYGAAMPGADDVVLPNLIRKWALDDPERVFVVFENGATWTYAEANRRMEATACALAELGLTKGDPVLVWWGMGEELTQIFLGVARLGAIFFPINTSLRFDALSHVVESSGATALIASADAAEHVGNVAPSHIESIITDEAQAWTGLDCHVESVAQLLTETIDVACTSELAPWDVHSVVFTSGTTGRAKGVTCTHLHTMTTANLSLHFFGPDDRYLIASPFCHLAGIYAFWNVARLGGSVAVIRSFRTQDYWAKIESSKATVSLLMGAMSNFLLKAAPSEGDRSHGLRAVLQQPLAVDAPEFARRFGVDVYTQYDMSELPPVVIGDVISGDSEVEDGYCGRARTGVEVRLVDENDCVVPDGEAGELIARMPLPWVTSPRYWNDPDATAATWRNGWFHSGDRLRCNPQGDYYFAGRQSDAIRRRGVSFSSTDIEAAVTLLHDVESAAALGVPSEYSEDEVMIFVQRRDGASLTELELIDEVRERLAHFMVPRYVRFLDELPRTESGKFAKGALRELAAESRGWDREQAGIVLKRPTAAS